MNKAYNAAIAVFSAGARVAALNSPKVRRMLKGQDETMQRLASFKSSMAPDGFDVWFHAASLGEFEQARPLIEALLTHNPQAKILLSFFSPSGYEVRHNYDARVAVVYMPFDTPKAVKTFLDEAAPKMAVFVKYEFWGNYLSELKRRAIPTYIISAIFRPGQIFFRPWGTMFRTMLRCFSHLYVQDERSRSLLASIGIDNVTVAGDTRFDRVAAIAAKGRDIESVRLFTEASPSAGIFIAGSSWPADEERYIPWLKAHPDVKAIIAPHEFDKDRLAELRRNLGYEKSMLLSDLERDLGINREAAIAKLDKIKYLIVDCFGMLSSLYRYGDVAYIGGGFGTGIHNINEAAVYGIPVVFGPNNSKFNEAAQIKECGGGFEVKDRHDIDSTLDMLFADSDRRRKAGKAAGQYIASHTGATPMIIKDLFGISAQESNSTYHKNLPHND